MTDSQKLDLILEKVDRIEKRADKIEERIDKTEEGITEIKMDITNIKLVIENEIRANIQRIAEGHLDLSRNLNNAMRPSSEVEMLAIKVSMMENDIKELKKRLA